MHVQTTRYSGEPVKPFAWSYSRLKNFEVCPKRHYHVDVKKDFKEADSEQLQWGNRVHKMLAEHIQGKQLLPQLHAGEFEGAIQRAFDIRKHGTWMGIDVRSHGANVFVEQSLAITKDFEPCEYFSKQAWYRAKADLMWTMGPIGCVVDWKTGKIVEDSVQLMLTAACMFYHYPDVQAIRSVFSWLKEDAETVADIKRSDLPRLWSNLWDRIETLRQAHETVSYPPTPNYLCKNWCPVKICPHNGG